MKRALNLMIVAAFSAALCLTACNHENGDNNGGDTPEYPIKPIVIQNAVQDIDGNQYNAVRMGEQVWMTENLRTTRYADGTEIPLGTSASSTIAYRYVPDDNPSNVNAYGYLYNWTATMGNSSSNSINSAPVQGICPDGWHVPSDAEWTQMTNYVGGNSQYVCNEINGNIAKALASTTGWSVSSNSCAVGNDQSSNNASGFSALPAGGYYGNHSYFSYRAYFWTADKFNDCNAYSRRLDYNYADIDRNNHDKSDGLSVRCVQD